MTLPSASSFLGLSAQAEQTATATPLVNREVQALQWMRFSAAPHAWHAVALETDIFPLRYSEHTRLEMRKALRAERGMYVAAIT